MWAQKDYVPEVLPLIAGFRDPARGLEKSIVNRSVLLWTKEMVINGKYSFGAYLLATDWPQFCMP